MKCTVCTHPQRNAIDRALLAGNHTFSHLSRLYGPSLSALFRHKKHLQKKIGEAHARLEAGRTLHCLHKLNLFLDAAADTLAAAQAEGDSRLLFQAVREGTRIVNAISRLEVRLPAGAVYQILASPQWAAQDSLLPPDVIAAAHQSLVNDLFFPCPDPDPPHSLPDEAECDPEAADDEDDDEDWKEDWEEEPEADDDDEFGDISSDDNEAEPAQENFDYDDPWETAAPEAHAPVRADLNCLAATGHRPAPDPADLPEGVSGLFPSEAPCHQPQAPSGPRHAYRQPSAKLAPKTHFSKGNVKQSQLNMLFKKSPPRSPASLSTRPLSWPASSPGCRSTRNWRLPGNRLKKRFNPI